MVKVSFEDYVGGKGNRFLSHEGRKGDAKRIRCSFLEVDDFWGHFFGQQAGGPHSNAHLLEDKIFTEREAWIAYRILKMHFFYDFRQIQTHITNLSETTGLPRNEVKAIVQLIMRKHLRDEFGNANGKLDELEITDNRHSELPTEKLK